MNKTYCTVIIQNRKGIAKILAFTQFYTIHTIDIFKTQKVLLQKRLKYKCTSLFNYIKKLKFNYKYVFS